MPITVTAKNNVTEFPPAPAEETAGHFGGLLAFETDCWDVHEALRLEESGFVLLDIRSPEMFALAHVPKAMNLPYGRINECSLAFYPMGTLFVVYCTGPQCNGADKAALRLADLGRPVKKMIGGFWGWQENGFETAKG